MKRIATSIAAGTLLAAIAVAQPGKPGYAVIDLGVIGNIPPGQPVFISANGRIAGAASPDGTAMHATVWNQGQPFDLAKAGVGSPNSAAFGINDLGQVVGQADTTIPNAEDFCGFNASGFNSPTACIPFLWQNGVMQQLPTLGGANGVANLINNRGQVAGWAEATAPGAGCPVGLFYPVVWEHGSVRQLTIPGTDNSGPPPSTKTARSLGQPAVARPTSPAPAFIWSRSTRCSGTATAHLTTSGTWAARDRGPAITPAR